MTEDRLKNSEVGRRKWENKLQDLGLVTEARRPIAVVDLIGTKDGR